MSELSDLTEKKVVDEFWNIHERVIGSDYVHASKGSGHLNIEYRKDADRFFLEIPDLVSNSKISHTAYGVIAGN